MSSFVGVMRVGWGGSSRLDFEAHGAATGSDLRRGVAALLLLLANLAAWAGCSSDESVIARVGDWELTEAELTREIAARTVAGGPDYDTAEARAALVNALVERKMLAEAARRAGYEDDPLALERYEQWLGAQYAEAELARRLAAIDVSAADVEHAYEERREALATPERVHLAVVLIEVPSYARPEARAEARERARQAHGAAAALTDRRDLGPVAAAYSDDRATRYLGGDAGWVERTGSRFPGELVDAAFEVADGELTPVVETPSGFAFARRLAHEPARVPTLEEAGPAIRRALLDERRRAAREAFFAEVRARVGVEVHPDRIGGRPSATPPEPTPPPVPGG